MLMFNYLFLSETYELVARDTCPPFWQNLKSWIFSIEACIQITFFLISFFFILILFCMQFVFCILFFKQYDAFEKVFSKCFKTFDVHSFIISNIRPLLGGGGGDNERPGASPCDLLLVIVRIKTY